MVLNSNFHTGHQNQNQNPELRSVDDRLEAIFRKHGGQVENLFCTSDGTKFNFSIRRGKNLKHRQNKNLIQQLSASDDVVVSNLSDSMKSLSLSRNVLEVVGEINTPSIECEPSEG